jgi:hypothetical protein
MEWKGRGMNCMAEFLQSSELSKGQMQVQKSRQCREVVKQRSARRDICPLAQLDRDMGVLLAS